MSIFDINPDITRAETLSSAFYADEKYFHDSKEKSLREAGRCSRYEDQAVVESVQKGITSRFYNRGRYSPNRE